MTPSPVSRLRLRLGAACLLAVTLLFLKPMRLPALETRQMIAEVTVEGNQSVKKRTVLGKVKIRKGDVVVDPAFRADVDRLLETGLFDDVQVALEDAPGPTDAQGLARVRVIFRVKERSIIKRVDFKGNLKLPARKFRDELASKPGEPHDRFKVAQDVQKILSIYRDEGYADAKVEYFTSLDPKKRKTILTFFMTEGDRVMIKAVEVVGNRTVSAGKIRRLMKKTRRKKVFKEDSLREDLDEVKKFYQNKGFLEVSLSPPARDFNEDHTRVSLTLNIVEGRRYRVGQFTFEGATLFDQKTLRKAITLKSGKLYRQDRMDESLQNIQNLYADKGYLRAEIVPNNITQAFDDDNGQVDIRFDITESSVVYVDRIYIDGNTYTKEQVIRREILLKEGDVFAAGRVRRSVEKIYNLGFLDDVQVDVQQPRSPTRADIVFSVMEGKPGILSAGAGFSSVDGLLGTLQLQHINLFGRAQRLNLLWEFGERKQNYEIGWTDPWFLGKRMSFGVSVFDTVRRRPFGTDSTAYREGRRGFSLQLGPRITEQLSLIHNYSYEEVRIYDIDSEHINDISPSEDITSSLTNGIVLDTRDNIFDASRGMRNSASVQVAGGPLGGDMNFYKPQLSSALYVPTFWKFVFSLAGRGGYVRHFAPSKEVPISERFVMGGVDTVRGYDFGEIGPEDYGRVMMVFNAEYKFPIVQERNRTILQGAFFADAGGSWSHADQVDLRIGRQENQMRSGVGFGIRFKTPVFPIRLDWGYGLNHRPGEQISQFYFTIGNIF
ncbi:MAG TPA: outer membrane protein assembly factor BamA [Elusimicrobiota bacterium]|nr:outer membrane protein assembly factor BamA [Elusimicrobiota bacterium]